MSNRTQPYSKMNRFDRSRILGLDPLPLDLELASRRSVWFQIGKRIPDLLTLLRVALGMLLAWSGLVDGKAEPGQDIWLLVLAWTTDMLDGRISRSLKIDGKSWLGRHDVYVDMFVSAAALLYIGVTGLLPFGLLLMYLLIWGAAFLNWGIPPLFAQVFQNPIYAFLLFLTVQTAPQVLPWLLLWALVALILFWPRQVELLRGIFHPKR